MKPNLSLQTGVMAIAKESVVALKLSVTSTYIATKFIVLSVSSLSQSG